MAKRYIKMEKYDPLKNGEYFMRTCDISAIVCNSLNTNMTAMRTRQRTNRIAHPRQALMYFLYKHTPMSTNEIADYIGWLDHTTVIHAYAKVEERLNNGDRKLEELERVLLIKCDEVFGLGVAHENQEKRREKSPWDFRPYDLTDKLEAWQ